MKHARASSSVEVTSQGASTIKADLHMSVYDDSEWSPEQGMRHLLNHLEGDRLEALAGLAMAVALIDSGGRQDRAAEYLGISSRSFTYRKRMGVLGDGQKLIEEK